MIRATSGKSMDGEELITWIAEWMIFGHDWTQGRQGPRGSRSALPSTIFPTSFEIDFLMYFGMDLASIFDTFWTFVRHFRFKTSAIEKAWIFM